MIEKIRTLLNQFINEINTILHDNPPSVCLYGSCVLDDFREGWSDIDFLALTDKPTTQADAEQLLELRQRLSKKYDNLLFHSLEGVIMSHDGLLKGKEDTVIYWGLSGQRIIDSYSLDCFARKSLLEHGIMLCGNDFRNKISMPTYEDLVAGVDRHYQAIRKHAVQTNGNASSSGWLLDIARGIYTIDTGGYIAKTEAAKWAVQKGLVPNMPLMKKVIAVRENPALESQGEYTSEFFESLGPEIQRFADVLYDHLQAWLNLQSAKDELWDVYDENRKLTGRTHRRADPMPEGDYHLVVHVWILNSKGEFLITKRAPNKGYPNMWETTGGSAVTGDTSLTAAVREVKEETGLDVLPENGKVVLTIQRDDCFCDIWLFKQDFDIKFVVLQDGETIDAKWAAKDEIRQIVINGDFIPLSYMEEFLLCKRKMRLFV